MRKCILYMVGLVLSVATIGCVKTDDPTSVQTSVLRLQLSNGEHSTRAEGDAENTDPLNEFKLATAQVFFLDASGNVLQGHYESSLNAVQEKTVTIPLSAEQITDLFDDNGKGHVYVIANYGSEITDATTLAALKAKAIGFEETSGSVATQSSFVMDSEPIEVTYDGQNKTISGVVPLTRAAAKIELTVNVAPLTQDGKTWTANTGAMTITLHNGVKKGIVDDDSSDDAPKAAQADATLFNDSRQFSGVVDANGDPITVKIDGVTYTQHVQTIPFYSYSTKWNAGDDDEVYLEVAIPWKVSTGSDESYQTFYYQVPVSIKNLALVRNNFYQLTLTVGVLGGLTERVTVEPSYTVIDWGSQTVNVNLSRPKYLVVDENYVVLDNLEEYSIGFQASDEVVVTLVSSTINNSDLYNPNSTSDKTWTAVYGFTLADNISVANGAITFNHQLDNTREPDGTDSSDRSGRYDYQSNTVTIKVALKNDSSINETITFVQNPAMYVTPEPGTSGSVFVNKNKSSGSGTPWYYVGSGTVNMSGNMYRITVSAFDESTADYLITDPRMPAEKNANGEYVNFSFYNISDDTGTANTNSPVTTATDIANDNTLTGYRATMEGDDVENFVAPEFIMASAYGHYQPSWENMYAKTSTKYRCAGYQEAGYPAGRWRIPTPAELEVIGKLCAERKIESIFNDGTSYMSSNGPYRYSAGDGTFTKNGGLDAATGSVRCVYDVWYWKDKIDSSYSYTNTFLWAAEGDTAEYDKSQYLMPVQ